MISGSGRSPGEANSNSLQNSSLGNPMDRGAYSLRGRRGSDTTEQVISTSTSKHTRTTGQTLYMLGGKQGVSDGWGECCFIQDGQGNVVTSKQRPKGSEGKSPTEIWRKERYRRKKQPVQKSWGGYTLDVFNKHERLLWRLVRQGG